MKILSAYILTILLSFAGGLFFPWWIIAVAAFIVAAVIPIRPAVAMATGAAAIGTLWTVMALIIDFQNNHVLASRVASILPLGGVPAYLIAVTAFIGSLVGGFGALSGGLLRRIFLRGEVWGMRDER